MKKILHSLFVICLSACAVLYPLDHLCAIIVAAKTYNERHVERKLNAASFLPSPDLAVVLAVLSTLSLKEQRQALNKLSGQQYTNLIQSNQVGSQQFMRRMYDSVRYDSLGLHCGENCDQFRFWTALGGGQACQNNSHGARGFKMDQANITLGADKPLNFCLMNSWLTVGVAGFYEDDNIHFRRKGRGEGSNWQGAIYYMWNNCNFYSFSTTILGSNCIKIRRPIEFGRLDRKVRSKARISQWTSYSEAGLNLCFNSFYVQPFIGIEYAVYRRHALSEHHVNSLDLHIRGKNVSATIGRLGVHLTTNLPWDLFLCGDIAWRYRFNFLQERIKVHFKDFGSEFRIKGVHLKPHGVEGALNLAKCFCERWQAYLEVAGEKWDRYSAWNASIGLAFTW